jgi:hypothetical protein
VPPVPDTAPVTVPVPVIVPVLTTPAVPDAVTEPPATVRVPAFVIPRDELVDVIEPVAAVIEAPLTTVMPPFVVSEALPVIVIFAAEPDRFTDVELGLDAVTVRVPLVMVSVLSFAVVPVMASVLMVVLADRVGWLLVVVGITTASFEPGVLLPLPLPVLVQLVEVVQLVLRKPFQVNVYRTPA